MAITGGRNDRTEEESTSSYTSDDLGMEVSDLSADEADAYHARWRADPQGRSRGVAAEKGLRPGMLIHKVGKTVVRTSTISKRPWSTSRSKMAC